MSQADRSVPNWGKTHPLPELEEAIAEINQLRIDPDRYDGGSGGTVFRAWQSKWNQAHQSAGSVLGIPVGGQGWNQAIDALDHYRDDWRGEVVPVRRVEVA